MTYHGESGYLQLLRDTLAAPTRGTRNAETRSRFGAQLIYDLSDGFPLLTGRHISLNIVAEELLFFLRGETDTTALEEKGVTIWRGNTRRAFLDTRAATAGLEEGQMGPMYGYQWRHAGVDQIERVITDLIATPTSRRLLFTTFNAVDADRGVLWPCHGIAVQLYVEDGRLSLMMTQRSADLFHGLPYNIASYALLTHLFCRAVHTRTNGAVSLTPGRLILSLGDHHIYENHVDAVNTLLEQPTTTLPRLEIYGVINRLEDVSAQQIRVVDYNPSSRITAPFNA